jgi:hypothetical protein
MTTDVEKQFFDTFGIGPEIESCYHSCTQWLNCKQYDEAITKYPEITDRILVELICILSGYQRAIGSLLEICETSKDGVKEEILEMLIFRDGALKQPVQELFKGNGNAE